MNPQATARQKHLYIASAAILVIGLALSTLVWFTAADVPPEGAAYIVVDGAVQAIAPDESKAYVREIERLGGKQAVLFDELGRWFAGLWRGRRLAFTLAGISAFVALALALFAYDMPNHPGSED